MDDTVKYDFNKLVATTASLHVVTLGANCIESTLEIAIAETAYVANFTVRSEATNVFHSDEPVLAAGITREPPNQYSV